MNYDLKDKIKITDEFLNSLIDKNWQEVETIQQQIDNIDTSTVIGMKVTDILKNACTNYYVSIGCLENLLDKSALACSSDYLANAEATKTIDEAKPDIAKPSIDTAVYKDIDDLAIQGGESEPFEYFVDFDEPFGDPLSDEDLYGN